MNKEHIKQLAKEFCSENGIMTVNDQPAIGMAKFLQSMIEKGEVISKGKYISDIEVEVKRGDYYRKLAKAIHPSDSTVSSAGKEVTTNRQDILSKHIGDKHGILVSDITDEEANQFQSSPDSTATPAKVISDEEIEAKATELNSEWIYDKNAIDPFRKLIQISKWIREQLTGK